MGLTPRATAVEELLRSKGLVQGSIRGPEGFGVGDYKGQGLNVWWVFPSNGNNPNAFEGPTDDDRAHAEKKMQRVQQILLGAGYNFLFNYKDTYPGGLALYIIKAPESPRQGIQIPDSAASKTRP
jgi:hypothetical protein